MFRFSVSFLSLFSDVDDLSDDSMTILTNFHWRFWTFLIIFWAIDTWRYVISENWVYCTTVYSPIGRWCESKSFFVSYCHLAALAELAQLSAVCRLSTPVTVRQKSASSTWLRHTRSEGAPTSTAVLSIDWGSTSVSALVLALAYAGSRRTSTGSGVCLLLQRLPSICISRDLTEDSLLYFKLITREIFEYAHDVMMT